MRDVFEHLSLEDATNLLQLIKDKHDNFIAYPGA